MHWHVFLLWLRRKHILTARRREKAKLTTPTRRGVGEQVKSSEELLVRSPCEKALSTKNCGIRTTSDVPSSLHDPRRGCRGHQDCDIMSPCSCCDSVSSFGGNNVSGCTKDNTTICAIAGKKEMWKPISVSAAIDDEERRSWRRRSAIPNLVLPRPTCRPYNIQQSRLLL